MMKKDKTKIQEPEPDALDRLLYEFFKNHYSPERELKEYEDAANLAVDSPWPQKRRKRRFRLQQKKNLSD